MVFSLARLPSLLWRCYWHLQLHLDLLQSLSIFVYCLVKAAVVAKLEANSMLIKVVATIVEIVVITVQQSIKPE